MKSFKQHSR
jgi:uroporphyrinogen-III synthase